MAKQFIVENVPQSGSELQIDTISHFNLKPLNQLLKGDISHLTFHCIKSDVSPLFYS